MGVLFTLQEGDRYQELELLRTGSKLFYQSEVTFL